MTKLLNKYHKVKTLTERGSTEGERAAAQAALERMEEKHPELKQGSAQTALDLGEFDYVYTWTPGESTSAGASNVVITFYWA